MLRRAAASFGRHGHRDSTLILTTYRHGFRAAELVKLRWEQIDFTQRVMHVVRVKRGTPSTHPVGKTELAALRKLSDDRKGPVFVTERGGPLATATVGKLVARAGDKAGLPFRAHPHMLRHACGYYLANQGYDTLAIQAYLGHRNIQHTVRYTDMAPDRFKNWWND